MVAESIGTHSIKLRGKVVLKVRNHFCGLFIFVAELAIPSIKFKPRAVLNDIRNHFCRFSTFVAELTILSIKFRGRVILKDSLSSTFLYTHYIIILIILIISLYSLQHLYFHFLKSIVQLSIMKHPDYRTVQNIRHKKCI